MKKLLIIPLLVMINLIFYLPVHAETQLFQSPYGQVLSSKAWDVNFSSPVNPNSIDGNIELLNLTTNTPVQFDYSLKNKDRTLTISSSNFEVENNYRLIIKSSLQSAVAEQETLLQDVQMDFIVENPETTAYLKAQWQTIYDGETIHAEFLDYGISKVKLIRPSMTLSDIGKYSVQNGYMRMNISSKTLYGKIEYTSATEFKITTDSGKTAIFTKM